MASPIDICNRALSDVGTRSTIADFAEGSEEASACALWYDTLRRQLLRAAPWGFARRQAVLSLLGSFSDIPPASVYPWGFKYTYPAQALRVRYLLPPNPLLTATVPTSDALFPPCAPSRANRFIIAQDLDLSDNSRKVVLSNLAQATAVYVQDETNVDLFEEDFEQALASALAAKLVIPLSGNINMKASFAQAAKDAVDIARANGANEAMPTTDHTPDWIAARGGAGYADNPFSLGNWFVPWDNFNWGM